MRRCWVQAHPTAASQPLTKLPWYKGDWSKQGFPSSGNINERFHLRGNTLYHNRFSYDPDEIFDPLTFELLVEVLDSCSPPHHSTTATVIVHVIPWATTVPTTSTWLTVGVSVIEGSLCIQSLVPWLLLSTAQLPHDSSLITLHHVS